MLNEVRLIGNLGQDPERRTTTSGDTVVTMSVATNERWKDKEGQQQERTEWHKVVVFGQQAETCAGQGRVRPLDDRDQGAAGAVPGLEGAGRRQEPR